MPAHVTKPTTRGAGGPRRTAVADGQRDIGARLAQLARRATRTGGHGTAPAPRQRAPPPTCQQDAGLCIEAPTGDIVGRIDPLRPRRGGWTCRSWRISSSSGAGPAVGDCRRAWNPRGCCQRARWRRCGGQRSDGGQPGGCRQHGDGRIRRRRRVRGHCGEHRRGGERGDIGQRRRRRQHRNDGEHRGRGQHPHGARRRPARLCGNTWVRPLHPLHRLRRVHRLLFIASPVWGVSACVAQWASGAGAGGPERAGFFSQARPGSAPA